MPISFAPRPPQGGQRSQDLSSKAATESLPLVLVDEQEICQREKHLLALDSCRCIFLQISLKFPRAGLAAPLRDEKRDSSLEQIRSAFSRSDDLRRLATFTSNLQKNPLFTSKQAGGGGGLARVWIERSSSSWPPGRRRSGLLKSALDSEPVFRRQLPHSQRDARADQVVPASTSHQARSAPAGETGAGPVPAFGKLIIAATGDDQEENGISSAFTCADGFRGCFDPWPSLSNKYHRSRGNTIIRSRQGRPFVGGVRSR